MTLPPNKPIICPEVVGRSDQLHQLRQLVEQALSGTGQTVLIAGEAGIGKSRLIAEVRERTAQQGVQVFQGSCFEPDRALPYAPLLDLFRDYCTSYPAEELATGFGNTAHELVKLVPEISTVLPSITPTAALEPEPERRRIFHSLVQFFCQAGVRQPVLLVMEDLHWCDDTTLEFLLHLARRLASERVLLLLTYRNDEVNSALSHFLAELDRERLAVEIPLRHLGPAEVDRMLRAIFEQLRPIRPEFLSAVYSLTEGNPFFVEEVLRSLIVSGDIFYADGAWDRKPINELRIPRNVHDAVQRRAKQLDGPAQQLLMLAAVTGRRFDFALLQQLTGWDELSLVASIKELVAAQLILEESADQFAFRHALTRQALYTQLLARERRALHRTIFETLERVHGAVVQGGLEDLAYHAFQAGLWDHALQYGHRAGVKAQMLHSPGAALAHFDSALEAARQGSISPSLELLQARARTRQILGDFAGALADHEEALRLARSRANHHAEWQALVDLGTLWASHDYARTGEHYQLALEVARRIGDPATVAHSLNRVGNWNMNVEQPLASLPWHHEALKVFQELHDQLGIAQTLDLLGMASFMGGHLVQGTMYYKQAVEVFRDLDERQGLVSSLATLTLRGGTYQTNTMVAGAGLAEAARDGEQALTIAREIGWRSGQAYALWQLGFCLGSQGDYEGALGAVREALGIAEEIEHRQWLAAAKCVLGALYLDMLEPAAAHRCLAEAHTLATELGSSIWIQQATVLRISAYLLQHEPEQARLLYDRAGAQDLPSQTMMQRQYWCAYAELLLATGDVARCLEVCERLVASAASIPDGKIIPRLWKLRGEALVKLGRPADAEVLLVAARDAARLQGTLPLLWRIQLVLGNLFQAQHRLEQAQEAFTAARELVEELAAGIPDETLRATFLRESVAFFPPLRPLSRRRAAKQQFGGLTAREREVAMLIALGRSNRSIAEELVIGERTVETHVGSILTKLEFLSRSQIAAWAVESGLAKRTE